jgi:DNA-binding transcriptional regulator YiaG
VNPQVVIEVFEPIMPGKKDPTLAARVEELAKLRLTNGMSQAGFAQVLNVSTKTVQSWEQGQRKPSQAALRLTQVFRQDPSGLLEIVGMWAQNQGARR